MKIAAIETHEIHPPLSPFNGEEVRLYLGSAYDTRTLIIMRADNGLEGLGEMTAPLNDQVRSWLERLRGTNPASWLAHPELPIWLAPAIYDLVGKYNEVPAHQLFGPAVRSWVPMAYWTVSRTPARMAEEVEHAVSLGYTWLKYHTDGCHNAVEQTRAMQEVAPPGFKVHYDLNFDNSVDHVLDLAGQLARFPIAGLIEDPLRTFDVEGHKILRQKCPLPIAFHHLPLGGREALLGLADGYILGHAPVGMALRRAGLFEAANVPFALQNVGGNITRALVLHLAASFEMATLHHCTDTFQWAEDVVSPQFQAVAGTIEVPQGPGLGVQLDREALERLKAAVPPPLPRALVRVRITGGPTVYGQPPRSRRDGLRIGEKFTPGLGEGYDHRADLDFVHDDGSAAFARLWERAQQGPVLE
jgi:L-alanine-DL-glutamate epimerase-like enolase superfamily enzyme